jgi:prophage regulatory protein
MSNTKTLFSRPINFNDRILRWPEVENRIGICRSQAHLLVSKGEFPPPIKLGARASGWLESEINVWLTQRIAACRSDYHADS